MPYETNITQSGASHRLELSDRARLSVTGVADVESFDESMIVARTVKGTMVIRGSELHLERLSLDSGEAVVTGTVDGIEYEDSRAPSGGLFSRLFK